jgi:hypothetical protein
MFKLYSGKNSLLKRGSRLLQGGETSIDGNKLGWWEKKFFPDDTTDGTFIITKNYEYKPAYLAEIVYGRSDLEWVILQYNGIVDVAEEFKQGLLIKLPSPQRIFAEFLNTPLRNANK